MKAIVEIDFHVGGFVSKGNRLVAFVSKKKILQALRKCLDGLQDLVLSEQINSSDSDRWALCIHGWTVRLKRKTE